MSRPRSFSKRVAQVTIAEVGGLGESHAAVSKYVRTLIQAWLKYGSDMVQVWFMCGSSPIEVWLGSGAQLWLLICKCMCHGAPVAGEPVQVFLQIFPFLKRNVQRVSPPPPTQPDSPGEW